MMDYSEKERLQIKKNVRYIFEKALSDEHLNLKRKQLCDEIGVNEKTNRSIIKPDSAPDPDSGEKKEPALRNYGPKILMKYAMFFNKYWLSPSGSPAAIDVADLRSTDLQTDEDNGLFIYRNSLKKCNSYYEGFYYFYHISKRSGRLRYGILHLKPAHGVYRADLVTGFRFLPDSSSTLDDDSVKTNNFYKFFDIEDCFSNTEQHLNNALKKFFDEDNIEKNFQQRQSQMEAYERQHFLYRGFAIEESNTLMINLNSKTSPSSDYKKYIFFKTPLTPRDHSYLSGCGFCLTSPHDHPQGHYTGQYVGITQINNLLNPAFKDRIMNLLRFDNDSSTNGNFINIFNHSDNTDQKKDSLWFTMAQENKRLNTKSND